MALNPTIGRVTERIKSRSRETRDAYEARVRRAQDEGPHRGVLSCSNLAHVTAACPAHDKDALTTGQAGNIGIVTAYNDMLSAHQPFEEFPPLIKAAARGAGATGGKILGAGAGGFMLLFCPEDMQRRVTERLSDLLFVPFRFDRSGMQVIHYEPWSSR